MPVLCGSQFIFYHNNNERHKKIPCLCAELTVLLFDDSGLVVLVVVVVFIDFFANPTSLIEDVLLLTDFDLQGTSTVPSYT